MSVLITMQLMNPACFNSDSPTKLDSEVMSALRDADIDPQKYPSVHKWKSTMKSYSPSDMQRSVGRQSFSFFFFFTLSVSDDFKL